MERRPLSEEGERGKHGDGNEITINTKNDLVHADVEH